jgi:hypothetical protein
LSKALRTQAEALFKRTKWDSPAGFHIGHGEGITKLSGRITSVMLDEVDLEEAGRFFWCIGTR